MSVMQIIEDHYIDSWEWNKNIETKAKKKLETTYFINCFSNKSSSCEILLWSDKSNCI